MNEDIAIITRGKVQAICDDAFAKGFVAYCDTKGYFCKWTKEDKTLKYHCVQKKDI